MRDHELQALEGVDWYEINATVNGRRTRLVVESRELLSDMLRDRAGACGVRVGCEHGVCGSCTVLVEGRPVRSCLLFAAQVDGHDVRTVESLADGERLGLVQEAFRQEHGLQCGYCTPGIMLSTQALLETNPQPTEAEILDMLGGHLCRCTGYQQILNAIAAAIEANREAAG